MLLVFDLDFTLWDCGGTWCDCTLRPYRTENGQVLDSLNRHIRLYPDVPGILESALSAGHQLAAASRTHEPLWAAELLNLLGVSDLFAFKELYPGPKLPHFTALKEKSGLEFSDMFFFDDEMRNIDDISALGVSSIHVEDGIRLFHLSGIPGFQEATNVNT